MIVIYDVDNIFELNVFCYLVGELIVSEEYGVVIGKFRMRNCNVSLLICFINIEIFVF